MASTTAAPRLVNIMAAQLNRYMRSPNPNLLLAMDPEDVRVWYGLAFGLDEPYKGGEYLFRLRALDDFPASPPKFEFLTQNGVFQPGGPICISIGEYHANSAPGKDGSGGWRAALGMKGFAEQVVNGLIVPEYLGGGIRIEILPEAMRRAYARNSRERNAACHPEIMALFESLAAAHPESEPVRALLRSRGGASPPKGGPLRAAPPPTAPPPTAPPPTAPPSTAPPPTAQSAARASNPVRGEVGRHAAPAPAETGWAALPPPSPGHRPARPGLYTIEAAKKQAALSRGLGAAPAPRPGGAPAVLQTGGTFHPVGTEGGAAQTAPRGAANIMGPPASDREGAALIDRRAGTPSGRLGGPPIPQDEAALIDSLADDEQLAAAIALSLDSAAADAPPPPGDGAAEPGGPPGGPLGHAAPLTGRAADQPCGPIGNGGLADSEIDDLLGELLG